ncbi:hypothetical protein NTR1_87 [Nocardia phage NTR1]|nr:hypothetical protein NTR1_87 [Nocardia phage NTR1]
MSESNPHADVQTQAHTIARSIGALDYLDSKVKEIGRQLAETPGLPEFIHMPEGGFPTKYAVRVWTPRDSVRRNVSRKDLKLRFPHAYRAVMTETKPEKPYHVRLDAKKGGVKATEWAALKAEGAGAQEQVLRERYGALEWQPDVMLRVLRLLRVQRAEHEVKLEQRKDALIAFVCDHELPLILPGATDGKIVLRENPVKVAIDYDALEARFPDAAALISRTPMRGTPRVMFRKYEEGFDPEGDAEAWEGE